MEAPELRAQLNFNVEKSTHSPITLPVYAHTDQCGLLAITELRALFEKWGRLMARVKGLPRVPQQFSSRTGARINEKALDGEVMSTCCVPRVVQPRPLGG